MTETDNAAASQDLAALKLPELRKMAADKGLKGISALRKGELIEAIKTGKVPNKKAAASKAPKADEAAPAEDKPRRATRPSGSADTNKSEQGDHDAQDDKHDKDDKGDQRYESRSAARRARRNRARHNNQDDQHGQQDSDDHGDRGDRDDERDNNRDNNQRGNRNDNRHDNRNDNRDGGGRRGRRGRRNRRGRNDNRDNRDNRHNDNRNDNNQNNQELDPAELQEVAGILDIVDNNAAFIRTTGYKASQNDVFVPNNLLRQFGMRSGDAVIGQVRANGQSQSHGNGRNRKRYNKLVRVDSVNGQEPAEAKGRPEFHKLTPLYPNQRLRLETEQNILTTRVIDLVMPIARASAPSSSRLLRLVRRRFCRTSPTRFPPITQSATSWLCLSTSAPRKSPTCSAA